MTTAFLDAARKAVHYGCIASDDAIAHGALKDIEGFEAIVNEAVHVLTPSEEDLQEAAKTHLDIINDVYSDDYAQHLSDKDDGYTASEFLKAYVERAREKKGWRHVMQHPHIDRLRPYWLRALADEAREGRINSEEFADAFQAGYDTKDEDDLWLALLKMWNPHYRCALETRIREGSPNVDIEYAALVCLLEHTPDAFYAIVADLAERGAANRLVEIGRGIAHLRDGYLCACHAAEAAAAQLPQPFDEICEAENALFRKGIPALSDAARDALASISGASDQVRALRLELDTSITLPVEDDVCWALGTSDDSRTAVLAVKAAIRHGMTREVEAALNHRFAHVAACALTAVTTPLATPLQPRHLAFATHRASPVRRALVEVLKTKHDPAHQTTLIKLAGDQWSKNTMHYGRDTDDYPIARAAVAALRNLRPLGDKDEENLFAIATDTSDQHLRDAILLLLAESGFAMQKKLFDLAVEPGNARIQSSAAYALLQVGEQIEQRVVDEITPQMLATRYEPVAGVLAVLLGWRGAIPEVNAVAKELATNPKRRVLLLLLVWPLKDRDRVVAEEIAAMLPAGHKAVAWALDGALAIVDDATIADLGDTAVCAEVLEYMKIKPDR